MISEAPIIGSPEDIEADGSSSRTSRKSYFCSYKFLELLLCLIPVPIGVYLEFHDPHMRPIPYQIVDDTIVNAFMFNFENTAETVPNFVMITVSVVIPFLLQITLVYFSKDLNKLDMVHKTLCAYILTCGLTQTLTNITKLYVGYFRPIFLDLCQPDENWQCTGEQNDLHQGRVSFVSGHASLSACGLLLFSYFLEDTFGYSAYKKRLASGHPGASVEPLRLRRIISVLCYAPFLVAYFIGTLQFVLRLRC